jgi:methyltransferase OMS1
MKHTELMYVCLLFLAQNWDFITRYLDKNAERHAKNWGCIWNRDLDKIIEDSGLVLDEISVSSFKMGVLSI